MSPQAREQIRQDLDLIERFARCYRKQFTELIGELNTVPNPQTAGHCLRMCVETVNMVLAIQDRIASALRQISQEESVGKPRSIAA
jgi:hypothetical protein